MAPGERIILVAAGAGAGIAATFNTPIGGVLFAIELTMPKVSVRTFLPVALSTGTVTFIGRFFFGPEPAFQVPALAPISIDASSGISLVLHAVLGGVLGVAAAAFVRGRATLRTCSTRSPTGMRVTTATSISSSSAAIPLQVCRSR